jgi:hypothetical protein
MTAPPFHNKTTNDANHGNNNLQISNQYIQPIDKFSKDKLVYLSVESQSIKSN